MTAETRWKIATKSTKSLQSVSSYLVSSMRSVPDEAVLFIQGVGVDAGNRSAFLTR